MRKKTRFILMYTISGLLLSNGVGMPLGLLSSPAKDSLSILAFNSIMVASFLLVISGILLLIRTFMFRDREEIISAISK